MMNPLQLRARDSHRATRNECIGLGRITDRNRMRRDLAAIATGF